MKTMTWIKIGLVSGFALAGSGTGLAQRSCLPFGYGGIPKPEYVTCTVTMEFVRPVDLDGDGVADFTHERFRSQHVFEAPETNDLPYKLYSQDDTVEALFPAGHVEVYWATGTDAWGIYAQPRIPAGWELPHPTWPWGKFWDYPVVHAQGLGMILRQARFTCRPREDMPRTCRTTSYIGYMTTEEVDKYKEVELEQYFGFRLRRADGWHLGWLRLRWHRVPGGWEWTLPPVELVDWAVHPEAEAGIVVGEPARPQLRCAREGEELVLRWSPVWTNAVLERAAAPAGAAWEPLAGVSNATARVPAQGPAAFYRLQVR
jgi:hypothetical protein